MKKILLLLILCLSVGIGFAQKYKDLHSLEVGDWLLIEHTEYYPYCAPGIEVETPWRAENVRRVIMKAVVTEKNNSNISFDFSINRIYDCRNLADENSLLYYDSWYTQHFSRWINPLPEPPDYVLTEVTYDISTGKIIQQNNNRDDLYLFYSNYKFPFGLKNAQDLNTVFSMARVDAGRIPKLGVPALIDSWNKGSSITSSIRKEATTKKNNRTVYSAIIGKIPEDVAYSYYPSETRVIGASFPLPPNVSLTYTDLSSTQIKKIRQLYLPYPCKYFIEGDVKHYKPIPWLISPGDSIQRIVLNDGNFNFNGKGSFQNRLYHSPKDTNLVQQLDPYWKRSFNLTDLYAQASSHLYPPYDVNNIDFGTPTFTSLLPLIDGWYQPDKFKFFLSNFVSYKNKVSKTESLSGIYNEYPESREAYYLNNHFLAGYPRYLMNTDLLLKLMNTEMLTESHTEYEDFIKGCPDTHLLNKVKNKHTTLQALEKGRNIKNTDIEFVKKKLPLIPNNHKYIIATIAAFDSYTYIYGFENYQKEISEEDLNDDIKVYTFYPGKPKRYYSGKDKELMDSIYIYIDERSIEEAIKKYGYSSYDLTIVMRQDGTIIYRTSGSLNASEEAIKAIKADMNRSESDFWKGFRRGLFITLALGLLLLIILKIRIDSKRRKERIEQQIKELELKAIRSQMNPHFIFNALGSIQNLIGKEANEEANEYLIHFSRLLRNVLNNSEKKLVPLSEEIEQLSLYLRLEQLRIPFNFNLEVEQRISPDLIEIPGMLIQPFVENSVKHAIVPKGGGEVLISFKLTDDILIIEIADNGPGISLNETDGFGIKAVSEELKLLSALYGKEIKLEIKNRKDEGEQSGCLIRLFIPVM